MANGVTVEPRTAPVTPPPVEPVPGAPEASSGGSSLPDEILQIPAMQAVFAGQPAAVSTPIESFKNRPEAKLLEQNKDALLRAGLGMYRNLGGDLGVIFNQLRISGEQLKAADQAGQLLEVAPPFDQVNASIAQSGESNPVLSAEMPAGLASAPAPAAANQVGSPVGSPKPLPASSQKAITNARLKNQMLGKPTDGPKPGQGRILNNILKPVV